MNRLALQLQETLRRNQNKVRTEVSYSIPVPFAQAQHFRTRGPTCNT
jgi:hypothetical protein